MARFTEQTLHEAMANVYDALSAYVDTAPVQNTLTDADTQRKLRCSARNVEERCPGAATRLRGGYPVCLRHARNGKFVPWVSAVRIDVEHFCDFKGKKYVE